MSEQRFKQALILIGLAMLVVIGKFISSVEAVPSCRSDWTKCTDNSDMANNYKGWSDAQYDCKVEATNQAKFGTPEWPSLYFPKFYPGTDYRTGNVTLVEPEARFQNGFGASWSICEKSTAGTTCAPKR